MLAFKVVVGCCQGCPISTSVSGFHAQEIKEQPWLKRCAFWWWGDRVMFSRHHPKCISGIHTNVLLPSMTHQG